MKVSRLIKIGLFIALFFLVIAFSSFLYYNYQIPILMYHHIDGGHHRNSLYVSPENFEKQMRFLRKNNYRVISINELLFLLRQDKPRPHHIVAITFDDGYKDNYSNAFKILRKYKFPAAIFISPGLVGKAGYLNWPQIKEMSENGIIIGSHTLTHAYLPGLSRDKIIRELKLSKDIIVEKLNPPINALCYPIGEFSKEIQDIARSVVGYELAFTTNRGVIKTPRNEDLFALRRIKIKDSANTFVLWAKLSGYYNLFRKVKDPY
jgi:peptidoglycan/xylan/chitin deacetylase (PgdA/CDA1 family)